MLLGPAGGWEDFRRADAALNASYGKLMKADLSQSTVTPGGVRETQRAWIKYRDAWVQFGTVKYPRISADTWRTTLTRTREAMLREVYDNFAKR